MKYTPLREEGNGNKWTTALCSINGGIHDQTQFRSAVEMLEEAVDTWTAPRLIHLILTGATVAGYAEFIDRMKRHMPVKAYKAAIEVDTHKGQHVHWMLIVDKSSPESMFDQDNDSSPIYRVTALMQRIAPDFEVTVAQPRRHKTPYIPLSAHTLQDAADWFSYALKVRSKPAGGGCYWSSRSAKRTGPAHRPARLVKPKHLCQIEF